jgi:hypothetical protein
MASKMKAAEVLLLTLSLVLAPSCASRKAVNPDLVTVANQGDMLALSDALEATISAGKDTPTDREYAYEIVRTHDEDTAAVMYARAAITGRLVQQKGLLAVNLVPDIERSALRSRELDPNFRDGAATRLLGTLYAVAPATLLKHGDSEQGVDLLEGLVAAHPDELENHLRLAEAYIALNDPAPAFPHLCVCIAHQDALRGDSRLLLTHLIADAGMPRCAPQ